jgi:hypothetical protein
MVNYKTQTPPPGRTREWYRESWTLMLDIGPFRNRIFVQFSVGVFST